MQVFVSWSGADSRAVASLIKEWVENVIQEADVWVSAQDIKKGEVWSSALWDRLREIEFGILALTKHNINAPWVLFEAGALSKTVKSRVIPILCNVDRNALLGSPLSQFQNALPLKQEMFEVIAEINSNCARPLPSKKLDDTFNRWWPDFESAFSKIEFLKLDNASEAKIPESERLNNIESSLAELVRLVGREETLREIARRDNSSPASELRKRFAIDPHTDQLVYRNNRSKALLKQIELDEALRAAAASFEKDKPLEG